MSGLFLPVFQYKAHLGLLVSAYQHRKNGHAFV